MKRSELEKKYNKFQQLNKEINYLKEQYMILEQRLIELSNMEESLNEINANKMFIAIGSDMFLENEIKDKEKVLVNVGANIFVKKDINNAKERIDQQMGVTKEVMNKINADLRDGIDEIISLQEELSSAEK